MPLSRTSVHRSASVPARSCLPFSTNCVREPHAPAGRPQGSARERPWSSPWSRPVSAHPAGNDGRTGTGRTGRPVNPADAQWSWGRSTRRTPTGSTRGCARRAPSTRRGSSGRHGLGGRRPRPGPRGADPSGAAQGPGAGRGDAGGGGLPGPQAWHRVRRPDAGGGPARAHPAARVRSPVPSPRSGPPRRNRTSGRPRRTAPTAVLSQPFASAFGTREGTARHTPDFAATPPSSARRTATRPRTWNRAACTSPVASSSPWPDGPHRFPGPALRERSRNASAPFCDQSRHGCLPPAISVADTRCPAQRSP
ncbi:hypothetical protein SCANM63S_02294 [Streptomyces canarius]